MPVAAPPYGSMAEGWLCVSTLKQTACFSSNSITPALSSKTLRHHGLARSCVALKTVDLMRFSNRSTSLPALSRTTTSLRKVLWTQCSDHVWAIISSSTSRGSRPMRRKYSWIAFISVRFRNISLSAESFTSAVVVELADRHRDDVELVAVAVRLPAACGRRSGCPR